MKLKLLSLSLLFLIIATVSFADTGSFIVGTSAAGDFDKYYPVAFADGGFNNNAASTLELGRSSVHEDSNWRGALMSKFTYHGTNWGNGANFIDADIHYSVVQFIAGWRDASWSNNSRVLLIWLRGGGTTYYYKSNYPITIGVYDGTQNALPYNELNGPQSTFKTTVDPYVNSYGITTDKTVFFNGTGESYFNGPVGIGTYDAGGYDLAVKGNIHAQEVKVDLNGWADYVFKPTYNLTSLSNLKAYIDKNHHLPEIPAAAEVEKNGVKLGEMNKILVKKVEELTLYLIEKDKEIDVQNQKYTALQEAVMKQQKEIDELKKEFKTGKQLIK